MSDYAGNIDGGATGAEALGKMWGKLFTPGSAIVTNPASYQVTQRGAGANMSVDIAPGAGLSALADYSIIVWSSSTINKTVTAADPTNPRNDIVVRYVDLTAYGATNNVGATKFKVISGTPAGSPSDPSNVAIQAAVGAGNPWERLARITLPANAPSVTNSYITDLRTTIAFAGLLYGGSNNTYGHTIPNVADDTVALLGATQTETGNKTFSGQVNINGMNIAGAWQAWTPTWTVLATGNATVISRYMQTGKTVQGMFTVTFGSTSAMATGVPTFTVPGSINSNWVGNAIVVGTARVAGPPNVPDLPIRVSSNTTLDIVLPTATGTYIGETAFSSTVPITWAAGNVLSGTFCYEAA